MDLVPKFVDAMKTAERARVGGGDMVAVVGKLFAGREARGFAHDFIALDDEVIAIAVLNNPFAAEQRDDAVGSIINRDKINECMRFIRGQGHTAMVIDKFVEAGGET